MLIYGAAEVVTDGGRPADEARTGRVAALAADPDGEFADREGCPGLVVGAIWERADRRRRLHAAVERRADREGLIGSPSSPGSTPAAAPSPRASSTPTPTCCSPAPARASSPCGSRAPATWRSSPRAAASCPRSLQRGRSAEQLVAHGRRWLDEMLGHGVTTIEAKSGYGLDLATELRLLEVAHRLGREGPIDVVPTFLGAHAVAPEFRGRPDGDRGVCPHVIEEQLPGVAAQGRARFCDVFCEEGVFNADQSRRILRRPLGYGLRPRLHADELRAERRRGAGGGARRASADHLATPSRRPGSRRSPPAAGGHAGRGDPPARHDVVPDERPLRPGTTLHRARACRSPSAPTSTRARRRRRACRWSMTVACLELG